MAYEQTQVRISMPLSTAYDARRSSITGSTLNGPNGSAQFFPVVMSTVAFTVNLSTGTTPSTLIPVIGILQDTPGPGAVADICVAGVTKAIAGLGTITPGLLLQTSSTSGGYVTPLLGGNGPAIGVALEAATAVGQVFTMLLRLGGTST